MTRCDGIDEGRTSRQEGRDDEAGLAEHDAEEQQVRRAAMLLDDLRQVHVQVQRDVDRLCEQAAKGENVSIVNIVHWARGGDAP